MRPNSRFARLWRTAAFRLAIIFAGIFGIGTAMMLALLDLGIAHYAENELHEALGHQVAIMRADVQLEGAAALVSILAEHVRTDAVSRYRYLVITPSGSRFNSGVPETATAIDGFGRVQAPTPGVSSIETQVPVDMLVLTARMADGTFLAVGRESYPLDDLRSALHRVALWGSLALMLFAMTAAVVVALLFLRRLELVNATTGRIMDGNLTERLPPIGFGQEFHDLTNNLNAMLDRLDAAMSALRQLSTDLAHDLRLPLTRLRNRLEEMESAPGSPGARIESAIEECDALLALFNAMLRIARLESGCIRQDMGVIDLSELAQRTVEAYQPAAEDGGRALSCSTDGPHRVRGNAALLSQALANLVDNGICHTPPGTTIEVCVRASRDDVLLTVNDDGPGVPDAELPHLTRRFYRVDHSRAGPGTGLGLTLVSAIADLHKAKTRLRSRNPGLSVELAFSRLHAAGDSDEQRRIS